MNTDEIRKSHSILGIGLIIGALVLTSLLSAGCDLITHGRSRSHLEADAFGESKRLARTVRVQCTCTYSDRGLVFSATCPIHGDN